MNHRAYLILTEGVWASLTGGWYFDYRHSHACNIFHLYIWLTFLSCPLINYLFFNTWISWSLYCLFIALIFSAIKLINQLLHNVLDEAKEDIVIDCGKLGLKKKVKDQWVCAVCLTPHQDEKAKIRFGHSKETNFSVNSMEDNNEMTSNTIDLKADVHCNNSESSFGNLSLLFKSDGEPSIVLENLKKNEQKHKDGNKTASGSEASLSNITAIYTQENSSNNSIKMIDNSNEPVLPFRRARSEIETLKRSDKDSKTTMVPPSHPVSMEIINSKSANDEKQVPLDKSRFNKDTEMKNNKYTKEPKAFQWNNNETIEMKKIEESSEKVMNPCGNAYVKVDNDSSEDGDESEISLCTNDSNKIKTSINKRSKQPMRKARFSSNTRKRSKSSATRSECINKKSFGQEIGQRKPNNVVTKFGPNNINDPKIPVFSHHRDISYSDSSSLSSIDDRKERIFLDPLSQIPSTSTGITRLSDIKALSRYNDNEIPKKKIHDFVEKDKLKINSNERESNESMENQILKFGFLNSSNLIKEVLSDGKHLATSHEDTTTGAVHLFQDEHGNWYSYSFDEKSTGLAKSIQVWPPNPYAKLSLNNDSPDKLNLSNERISLNSLYINNLLPSLEPSVMFFNNNNNGNGSNNDSILKHNSNREGSSLKTTFQDSRNSQILELLPHPFRYGTLPLQDSSDVITYIEDGDFEYQFCNINLKFNRLKLLAFLDRNLNCFEVICSILLAILVALFSSILLSKSFFHDFNVFVFCIVVAGSQYSLLKSVQPDAASPTHGFNRISIYSRAIYFCLVSIIILVSSEYYHRSQSIDAIKFEIYGFNLINPNIIAAINSISQTFLLIFPLLFVFGLLPQCNTFVTYIFEHIDIHVFGGTASTLGMISGTYSIIRSILAVTFLYFCAHLFNLRETQRTRFSVFCGIMVTVSYLLSRSPSNPTLVWNVIYEFWLVFKNFFANLITSPNSSSNNSPTNIRKKSKTNDLDPLPEKLKKIMLARFESDFITCLFIAISVFSVHASSIFKFKPSFNEEIAVIVVIWSLVVHYFVPQFRKELPWLIFSSPFCKSYEYGMFEATSSAKKMWFEKLQTWLLLIEKNILCPLLFLGFITTDCPLLIKNYGHNFGIFLLVLCGFKCLRSSFNDASHNFIIIVFSFLFQYDCRLYIKGHDRIFLINYFIISIVFHKIYDFLLKLRFVFTYVAPWQVTWGSAFHAFAQPFSVPHSAFLFVQIFISSLLSSPLQPVCGSAIFLTSYVRPIKFWERDYNTKRVDHSNIRLVSQIERTRLSSDDNNLDSVVYEHLTRSLQHFLYGDLALGRWGNVYQGDYFILTSDNLNCLVHIIELGNGFVTFQVRGLEFRGTYCQQREVEAITENVNDDVFANCNMCGVLNGERIQDLRWLSWQIIRTKYVLEGYTISEHDFLTIIHQHELRRALITYYVKSIIYFCVTHKKFIQWIQDDDIVESLKYLNEKSFVDLDPIFKEDIDEDYDGTVSGITLASFKNSYLEWIKFCIEMSVGDSDLETTRKKEDVAISLCFGLSLLGRHAFRTASLYNPTESTEAKLFLFGFHALFKGDCRIDNECDQWVYKDINFLDKVIIPSVRMSLKLNQDHIVSEDDLKQPNNLFKTIADYQNSMVISHEADPSWRKSILSSVPSLLTLRHVSEDGNDEYKVIWLNKKILNFRIIKVNRECVRGLWAGQQQELIFLRNRNAERGSIQNARQVLRNIINSSCDQPIGYPIYVSPLTTSFSETSKPLKEIVGPSLSFSMFKKAVFSFFNKIRNRCNEVCTSSDGSNDFNSRFAKSESDAEKGLDDSNAKGSLIVNSHSQIVRFINKPYLKKTKNEEDGLYNSNSSENTISLLQNPMNSNAPESCTPNAMNLNSDPNKSAAGQSDSNSVNREQPNKSLIIEKGTTHPKGDAV